MKSSKESAIEERSSEESSSNMVSQEILIERARALDEVEYDKY